jgi:hypothetical protein
MAHTKAKLKSDDNKASPFRPFLMGNISDRGLHVHILLQVLFKHNLLTEVILYRYQNISGVRSGAVG